LVADLPKTSVTPEIRVDVTDAIKFELVRHVQRRLADCVKTREELGQAKLMIREVVTIDGVRAIFDEGWGLIRASNTQPALVLRFEATSPERLATIRAMIEGELTVAKQALNC
jgi:phosphomannomutase/phosphoglucomutase